MGLNGTYKVYSNAKKHPKAQSKTLAFGTPSVQYNDAATDCYGDLSIEVEYFYVDVNTGLTVPQGFTDVSIDVPAYIATRQHEDDMSLDAYIPDLAALAPSKWLTNQPLISTICLQESLFFSTIFGDANHLRVTTYDGPNGTGAVIDEAFLVFPISGFNSQVAFGVGPNELRATTFTVGTLNIDNVLVQSYRLTVGLDTAPMTPLSESYIFNLSNCCGEDWTRLHWLNRLGGTDAFTFKSLNVKLQETTSDTAEKPLTWDSATATPHNINDKGSFKIDSRAVIKRTLETTPIAPDFAEWLAELLSSPEVYLETNLGLVPIVISDVSDQQLETTTSTELALVRFSIDTKDANERIIQRN